MGTHSHTHTQHIHTQLCMCVGEIVGLLCAALPFYAQLTQLQVRHAAKQTQRPPATPSYILTHTHTHPAFIIITSQNICALLCQNNAENVDECSGHSAPHARTLTNTATHTHTFKYSTLHTYRRHLARQRGVKFHKKIKKGNSQAKWRRAGPKQAERGWQLTDWLMF